MYGAVPPETVKFIEPVLLALHKTFTCEVEADKTAWGCVIVVVAVAEQPFAEVTVTV